MQRLRPEVIRLEGVSKAFPLHERLKGARSLKGALVNARRRRRESRRPARMGVLRDVHLRVRQGDFLAILGSNGAGKSTLLKLIAGIYRPDAGLVKRRGRIASLLELGTGFHPEFTGRENVLINGAILGLSSSEIRERLPAIADFSGLGEQIDAPVRTYSSGMYVRLGFSVAAHVIPTVLLVDEVLAVGDYAFRQRCLDKIGELNADGTTVLFVSHETDLVRDFATRAVLVRDGRLQEPPSVEEAVKAYEQAAASASRPRPIATG